MKYFSIKEFTAVHIVQNIKSKTFKVVTNKGANVLYEGSKEDCIGFIRQKNQLFTVEICDTGRSETFDRDEFTVEQAKKTMIDSE